MAIKKNFNNFDELLTSSDLPVLVDFYATWCGPCKIMAPILEQVNQKMKNKLRIIKIDTDKYPKLASQHHIEALPTLVLFQNGQPVDRIEGVMQTPQLLQHLNSIIKNLKN
ncbi:MAG: thioredoxin [Trichodesmium sp. MAG_R03]|nr:thioredoxin [Trichodesmium sp. MAG_R03]